MNSLIVQHVWLNYRYDLNIEDWSNLNVHGNADDSFHISVCNANHLFFVLSCSSLNSIRASNWDHTSKCIVRLTFYFHFKSTRKKIVLHFWCCMKICLFVALSGYNIKFAVVFMEESRTIEYIHTKYLHFNTHTHYLSSVAFGSLELSIFSSVFKHHFSVSLFAHLFYDTLNGAKIENSVCTWAQIYDIFIYVICNLQSVMLANVYPAYPINCLNRPKTQKISLEQKASERTNCDHTISCALVNDVVVVKMSVNFVSYNSK